MTSNAKRKVAPTQKSLTSFFSTKKEKKEEPKKDDEAEKENIKMTATKSPEISSSAPPKGELEMLFSEKTWLEIFAENEFQKSYFKQLSAFLANEFKTQRVFPPKEHIFRCFNTLPIDKVKVVIIGQDPYHDTNQAMGLCFSVNKGIKIPSSLLNMYKELKSDLNCRIPTHGDLSKWQSQGIMMLNTSLTVRAHNANSHSKKGWEQFTDKAIEKLAKARKNIVFLLWGKNAQEKEKLIKRSGNEHLVLKSAHPSGLSAHRGFFGNKHFSQTNAYLKKNSIEPIDWQIESATYR
jgi:uracil-DNA glycosylase|tara:strand:+ start:977 stop:1855 length:879 start_codon:yes stop_codon:yes gene_type:complete